MELVAVEEQSEWARTADTFTQWVDQRAAQIGLAPATLWRALSAAKRYEQLRHELAAAGAKLPRIQQLPAGISAQSVELLERISRVAPIDTVSDLALRLVRKEVSREHLRAVWESFAPLTAGETHRGRGAKPDRPRIPARELALHALDARISGLLRESAGSWLPDGQPKSQALYINVWPEGLTEWNVEIDAVLAVRRGRGTPLELHAFEIKGAHFNVEQLARQMRRLSELADYVWVASDCAFSAGVVACLPVIVGLLVVSGDQIRVLRAPDRCEPSRSEALAKALIL